MIVTGAGHFPMNGKLRNEDLILNLGCPMFACFWQTWDPVRRNKSLRNVLDTSVHGRAHISKRHQNLGDNWSMAIQMSAGETDDPGFIEAVDSIVSELIACHAPEQFWIIQIDNWFDHKWLRFSGYGLIASDIPLDRYDTVKAESYQGKVTFPPFAPNRVLSQFSFVRVGNTYTESALPALPHTNERKHSETNLRRRIQDFTRSACFVWYSANTVANGRGSVMVYIVIADQVECWFAAFNREEEWKLKTTKGVTRSTLEHWLQKRTQ